MKTPSITLISMNGVASSSDRVAFVDDPTASTPTSPVERIFHVIGRDGFCAVQWHSEPTPLL